MLLTEKLIYFTLNSQIQQIVLAAWNSGLGPVWVGVTTVYEKEKLRYWSSGKEFDFSGAAWANGSLDGSPETDECAVVWQGDELEDEPCGRSFYAVCELQADLCGIWVDSVFQLNKTMICVVMSVLFVRKVSILILLLLETTSLRIKYNMQKTSILN